MSDETKAALEAAIDAHISDEYLDGDMEGAMVSDWLLITACLPAERTDDINAIYTVSAPDHAMNHQSDGLAFWFLYGRDDEDRER